MGQGSEPPLVVGLGEVLWDLLPSGRQLGGAPANFAYCSQLLGNRAVIASRIGNDELGRELRTMLDGRCLGSEHLQVDSDQPSGTVQVQLGPEGQPRFEITEPAAWDFLEFNESWQELAKSADAVCFGSLAQRSRVSRKTILRFLDSTPANALRIFDVNLRQSFFSAEVVDTSLRRANVLKLNHEEAPVLGEMLVLDPANPVDFCRNILERFQLQLVCITRGAHGSLLVGAKDAHEHPGLRITVNDTVGAGDAFTAGLVHELLRESGLSTISDTANRMGAWVASQAGGMPLPPEAGLEVALGS